MLSPFENKLIVRPIAISLVEDIIVGNGVVLPTNSWSLVVEPDPPFWIVFTKHWSKIV